MANDTDARRLIRSEREPGRNYDLFDDPSPTRVLVDGASRFTFGPALSRVDFYQTVKTSDGLDGQPLETREQSLTLIIPTIAFLEFLTYAVKGLQENQEKITQVMDGQSGAFRTHLTSVGKVDARKQ
jgi:hypothetical protein